MGSAGATDVVQPADEVAPLRQKFQCPICRADGIDSNSEVAYTRMNATRDKITRRRRCVQNTTHTFTTEESTRTAAIVEMWIRRSTDSKIESRFSSARLQRDIRRASLGRIEDADLTRVISEVTATLSERFSELCKPLDAEERSEHSSAPGAVAVWDVTIMESVERALNDTKTRIPHVLYALGVRGQVNLAHRSTRHSGFVDSTAFLKWLFSEENYPRLARTLPAPKIQRSETWWSPTNLRHPDTVIKRSGEQRKFDYEQFHKSISLAMLGRSRWVLESKEVANWVLVQIEGQRRVTSSHLAALVSTALRRTDDIAYLRWAILEKRFSSVAEIADEAEDLVAHPSIRLRFAPQGQPRTDAAAPNIAQNDSALVSRLRSLLEEIEPR